MRVLTVTFSGAATIKWTPEKNYTLRSLVGGTNSIGLLISPNAARVIADLSGPASNAIIEDVLWYSSNTMTTTKGVIAIPLSKGIPYYFTSSGIASFVCFLD